MSHFKVEAPRFDAKASFNEAFTSIDGSGRMAMTSLVAGANGLANFVGDIGYKGALGRRLGRGQAVGATVANGARSSPIARGSAAVTAWERKARHLRDGGRIMPPTVGSLAPRMFAGVTQPLAAAAKTPIGPVATSMATR